MIRKLSNKYFVLYVLIAVMICLFGCGNSNNTASSKKALGIAQEEITYVTQAVALPEYASLDGAYSEGNDLYYAAAQWNQTKQQYETAFYTIKQGTAEPKMIFSLEENQRVQSMTMDVEGNIYYLGYEEPLKDGEGGSVVSNQTLYKVDREGSLLLTLDLTEYTRGQEQSIIQGLAVDGEKHIVLFTSDQTIFVLNPDGSRLFETRAPGRIYDICNSGGKVFLGCAEDSGMAVREIDISGKKLSAKLEYNIPGNQFYMASDNKGNLLIATQDSVYQYALEQEEIIKKFDWETYDSAGMTAGILLPFGENGILAIDRNYGVVPMKIEATAFREAIEGEVITQDETVLTLGVLKPLPSALKAEIVYFNKANPNAKIEVINYEENFTRLNTEMIAGNAPDLLVLPSERINQFAGKGVLEDLNPYLDAEETVDRSELLENILEAFEIDGYLYGMPLDFDIYTMVGKASVLEEKPGWSLEDLLTFVERYADEKDIFDNTSKSGVFNLLKYAYGSQLLDMNHSSDPLNRELLVKMLTFANQYENDDQYTYDTNLSSKILEEQVILLDTQVYSGFGYFALSSLFGEPIHFIGYPTEGRNGNLIYSSGTFAISSSSEHKDIAWKFISALLSKEAQRRMENDYSTKGFHIRKDALEYHFSYCKEDYDSYVYYVYLTSGDGFSYRDIPGELVEEDIEQVRDLILNADTVLMISPDIEEIIDEEASFYFSGTKPVEEVVDVIANKVTIYVNENR